MKARYVGLVLVLVGMMVGCSTKNYGRQPELTGFEKQTLSCREIDIEQAKVEGFLTHVRNESQFDGRSVLSFLGDFGIGNLMEKDAAVESANLRLVDLSRARMSRNCSYASAPAPAVGYAPAQTTSPIATGPTREQQIQALQQQNLSYEEYMQRFREIEGQ